MARLWPTSHLAGPGGSPLNTSGATCAWSSGRSTQQGRAEGEGRRDQATGCIMAVQVQGWLLSLLNILTFCSLWIFFASILPFKNVVPGYYYLSWLVGFPAFRAGVIISAVWVRTTRVIKARSWGICRVSWHPGLGQQCGLPRWGLWSSQGCASLPGRERG